MDKSTDLYYEHNAANLLHAGLTACSWEVKDENTEIDREKIVSIFKEACSFVNRGGKRDEKYMAAEAVVSSCIRAVRCICLNEEASHTLIQGELRELDALSQYQNAIINYEHMK